MIWELYQQYKISSADQKAEIASRQIGNTNQALLEHEQRMDRMALTVMAMWSLLSEKLGITEIELEDRIRELDLSDGKLDGKVRTPTSNCPSCGRVLAKRHSKCMYCGESVSPGTRSL